MKGISTRDQETFYQVFKLALIGELTETSELTGLSADQKVSTMISEAFMFHRDMCKQPDLTPDTYIRLLTEKALERAADVVIDSSYFYNERKNKTSSV